MRSFLIIFVMSLGLMSVVSAQEIKVKSFQKLDRDLTARTQPRLDLNDEPCSVVRIVTTEDSVHIEGNMIGDPVYKKGEVLVYMTKGSKRLTVSHEQYGVVRYEFPEKLADQAVYELTLRFVEDKNNKLRTLVMPNISYGGTMPSYGIMIGIVKKTGGYLKIKSDFGKISGGEKLEEGAINDYWYSGSTQYSRLAATAGLLQRLWTSGYLYVGAGYGYRNVAWETVDHLWIKNMDKSYTGVEAEVGLIYRLNNFALSLGGQTNSFKVFEGSFGIGIMF